MGVTITATNSSYDFDMGCGGFFNLRKNIAIALDPDFGQNYANLAKCYAPHHYQEHDKIANCLIRRKELDKGKKVSDMQYFATMIMMSLKHF